MNLGINIYGTEVVLPLKLKGEVVVNKQLIKEIIREMVRDGEISIKVSSSGDYYSYQRKIDTVADVEYLVGIEMSFELEVDDE